MIENMKSTTNITINQHQKASIDGLKESELKQGKMNSLINDYSFNENLKIEIANKISNNAGNQEREFPPLEAKNSADMAKYGRI
jgi:hypothetical protein